MVIEVFKGALRRERLWNDEEG
ncbi:hypothetical protein CGLO_00070 [Colletotrichum gloeosporioides Cg-14]|uniref:Uncharacterized protein n=1 Tax=Colletotrichum gloeosporioides (strain Cg-14) TaxID=1237896 RepID=T0MEL4_COLGC|nr:hypothetical protein CGLO_00070 [Colletotrichum gloeosporioides Cg-14]